MRDVSVEVAQSWKIQRLDLQDGNVLFCSKCVQKKVIRKHSPSHTFCSVGFLFARPGELE